MVINDILRPLEMHGISQNQGLIDLAKRTGWDVGDALVGRHG